jgi:hypothetical protein
MQATTDHGAARTTVREFDLRAVVAGLLLAFLLLLL